MGGELGNEICIEVLLLSSAMFLTKFHIERERRFACEFSAEKLAFFDFADFSARAIVKRKEKISEFSYTFFCCMCAVLWQGQCGQFASLNSQKRWCSSFRKHLLVILYVHPGKWLQNGRPSMLVGVIPCSSRNTAVLRGRKKMWWYVVNWRLRPTQTDTQIGWW